MHSASGRRALQRFFAAVRIESAGKVSLDLDITAAVRPGYFGAMREAGALFVENRYTDWHNYWPHATLRNLWQLSQYVDPLRLRMEFLNHTRNATLYEADPLAPRRYRADYLFASVMFASPLAWFEVAGLSEDFIAQVAPLVRTWKAHRRALRDLSILPVGDVPDGSSWTGFAAHDPTGAHGYLLLFRELNDRPTAEFSLPMFRHDEYDLIFLAGTGRLDLSRGHARAEAPAPLSFLLAQLSRR
jgi:alpha-galactosidase